jgi:hypothetical protein
MVRIHAGQPSSFLIQKIGRVLNTPQQDADVFFGEAGVQHPSQEFGLRLSSGATGGELLFIGLEC